ncbi:MAG: type VI secretion system protein TssA [Myxococcota bacterium]
MNDPNPSTEQAPTGADPTAAKFAELAKPFEDPIPGAARAGENARYEEMHEAIRNEIDKLNRPDATPADWQLIEREGRAILTSKSKDYLIASYFAVAAYLRQGPRGLVEGIAALCAVLEHYWDDGFPPAARVRARVNAIDWCIERAGLLREQAPSAGQPGDLQLLGHAAKKLDGLVRSRFQGDEAPNIYSLKETLERIELSLASSSSAAAEPTPSGAPSPAPAADASAPAAAPSGATSATPAAPASGSQSVGAGGGGGLGSLGAMFAAPIAGAARAGENARYDDTHEAVRKEVDKLGSPTADPVNWEFVRDASRDILTGKSKDFLIASYFAVGSYLHGGPRGLAQGMAALSTLLRDYWDDGFPPVSRIRARVNAIDWFVDKVGNLGELAPKAAPEDDVRLVEQAGKELEALVRERFQDQEPNIDALRETLQRIESSLAKSVPARPAPQPGGHTSTGTPTQPGAPAPGGGSPAIAPVQLAAPSAELADPAEVNKFLKQVGDSLYKASRALFKVSKGDPLAYRLCRQGLYMQLQAAPPTTNGNQTVVPPPPPNREAQLNGLLSGQNWDVLLDEAESGLSTHRLWLDAHRFVAMALGGLGHDDARDTVLSETVSLAQRVPGLLDLAFNDGQPFASPATREWIGTAVSAEGDSSAAARGSAAEDSGEFDDAMAEARKLAVGGKLEEAVAKLQELILSEAPSGRDRFRAKLAMAEACASAGAASMAEGILAGLTQEIREFRLEEWEPKIAEACYLSRYEALAAMASESAKAREELVDVYRQLCAVAPAAALKLGKPPS